MAIVTSIIYTIKKKARTMNSNRNLLDEKRLQSLIKKAVAEEFDVREKTKQQEEDREDKIEASKFKHFYCTVIGLTALIFISVLLIDAILYSLCPFSAKLFSILATIIGAVTLALSTHHDYTHKTMKNCMKNVEIFGTCCTIIGGYRPKCVSVLACVPLWQWAFLLFELYGRGTRGRPECVSGMAGQALRHNG